MGTNYYAVKKKNRQYYKERNELINLIKANQYDEAEEKIDEIRKVYIDGIHLGKKSLGWKFCFDHNNEEYYECNKASIKRFLREGNYEIIDEYHKKVSKKEFWDMVIRSMKDPNNIGSKEYDEMKRKEGRYNTYRYCYAPDKIRVKYNCTYADFYNDGLRFASYTDFS